MRRKKTKRRDEICDATFRALADPTRRRLLDRLYVRDGQSLAALCKECDMTRFGVMKHLRVLEEAGLIISRRRGAFRLHFLNTSAIETIYNDWICKFVDLDNRSALTA
jgi:DNA-binding transcriptional ArsR family regulator